MAFLPRIKLIGFVALVASGLSFALPAAAIDLDQARTQGSVGERSDGLVAAVDANATSEVRSLVETVNAARMQEYKSIAQKNGTPLDAVQAIAGEKQIQRARQNKWYVMDASGRWSKP